MTRKKSCGEAGLMEKLALRGVCRAEFVVAPNQGARLMEAELTVKPATNSEACATRLK